jgi:sugar phosphate isomerase/epimerase
MSELTRRQWLAGASVGVAGGVGGSLAFPVEAPAAAEREPTFRYMFNTATIRGQKLSVVEEVDIAARAGYQGFEPWIRELEDYVKGGGKLEDLGKRIRDKGLQVESAIGFAPWIVDNEVERKKGLEQARRDMDLVAQLGGKRLAAPPVGATNATLTHPDQVTTRYRALLELGKKMGVIPQVEVWGFSKTLSRLGEAALVAIEAGEPGGCVLADVYHLYKGGSGFSGVKLLSGSALQVFHMNDYPADPPRDRIKDADRVYPGDGVAPLVPMLRDLREGGFRGFLSLELFNPNYYKEDAFEVARKGLEKMKAVVALAQKG